MRQPNTRRLLLPLLAFVLWEAGCSRPGGSDAAALQPSPQVPFRAGGAQAVTSADSALAVPEQVPNAPNAVPFHDPQSLPAGTLLTVRLKVPISSDSVRTSSTFEAEIEDPVAVDGATLISAGAVASGRVEEARPATQYGGYLRLTLNSIALPGRDLTLKTSSLFVRGKTGDQNLGRSHGAVTVRLAPGRRLTFRLSEPAYIPGPLASAVR
jgi:hypothetical protein